MSIYPVKINEWHDKDHEKTMKVVYELLEETRDNKCIECGKEVNFENAYMMHAVPYGYGDFRVWCEACMMSDS